MKIGIQHYSILSGAIKRHLNLYTKEELQKALRDFQANKRLNDYRIALIWSIFHKVRDNDQTINDMIHNSDYKDTHIETALKKIFKEYGYVYP